MRILFLLLGLVKSTNTRLSHIWRTGLLDIWAQGFVVLSWEQTASSTGWTDTLSDERGKHSEDTERPKPKLKENEYCCLSARWPEANANVLPVKC